jgi:isopenicillin-N epimerase
MKQHFLLDPSITFLNHGSFGACPRPVFEVYQDWQRELERQPVKFLARDVYENMYTARAALAAYINAAPQDLVYLPNPTIAGNVVARSLRLNPGDEILATDHEYGALDRTWRFVCTKTGAHYIRRPIPVPVTTPADLVETFWAGVTGRTRVIFISHITSATAIQFPVEEICRRARTAGILSIVDGAHAPGQIPLDLQAVGADFYLGACHKWLCAPKGAAFLHARPAVQPLLEPLIVSWGYEDPTYETGYPFINQHEWQGTRDLAPFLSVPAAIQFQRDHNWDEHRQRCRHLVRQTRQRIAALTGLDPVCPDEPGWFTQFFATPLPELDPQALKLRLYEDYRIEIPVHRFEGRVLIRASFQAYNDQADADTLVDALAALLPR